MPKPFLAAVAVRPRRLLAACAAAHVFVRRRAVEEPAAASEASAVAREEEKEEEEEEEAAEGVVLVTAGVISKDLGRRVPRPATPVAESAGVTVTVAAVCAVKSAAAG